MSPTRVTEGSDTSESKQLQQLKMLSSPLPPLFSTTPLPTVTTTTRGLGKMNVYPYLRHTSASCEQQGWVHIHPFCHLGYPASQAADVPAGQLGRMVRFSSWPVIAVVNILSWILLVLFNTVKLTVLR